MMAQTDSTVSKLDLGSEINQSSNSISHLSAHKRSQVKQGSYRQDCVKFKDFSRTSQRLSFCFQGLKTYEKNTDLNVKILLLKC